MAEAYSTSEELHAGMKRLYTYQMCNIQMLKLKCLLKLLTKVLTPVPVNVPL